MPDNYYNIYMQMYLLEQDKLTHKQPLHELKGPCLQKEMRTNSF